MGVVGMKSRLVQPESVSLFAIQLTLPPQLGTLKVWFVSGGFIPHEPYHFSVSVRNENNSDLRFFFLHTMKMLTEGAKSKEIILSSNFLL